MQQARRQNSQFRKWMVGAVEFEHHNPVGPTLGCCPVHYGVQRPALAASSETGLTCLTCDLPARLC